MCFYLIPKKEIFIAFVLHKAEPSSFIRPLDLVLFVGLIEENEGVTVYYANHPAIEGISQDGRRDKEEGCEE